MIAREHVSLGKFGQGRADDFARETFAPRILGGIDAANLPDRPIVPEDEAKRLRPVLVTEDADKSLTGIEEGLQPAAVVPLLVKRVENGVSSCDGDSHVDIALDAALPGVR